MKLLRWFALLLCLCVNAENIAMWRDSGENVTLRCFTAGCSSSIKGYDGMYLYHQTDHTKEKQVLYYHAEPGLIEQMTAEDGFKYRIQKDGSLKNHTFTISQLTVDDSGFYICRFVKFPSVEARCSAYTLFVKGVAQCSRSTRAPCALAEEIGPPLVLIIIAACTIGTLVTIILMLLIVPRARRRIRSRTRTASVPNDNVYEDMNKNGLRPPPEG